MPQNGTLRCHLNQGNILNGQGSLPAQPTVPSYNFPPVSKDNYGVWHKRLFHPTIFHWPPENFPGCLGSRGWLDHRRKSDWPTEWILKLLNDWCSWYLLSRNRCACYIPILPISLYMQCLVGFWDVVGTFSDGFSQGTSSINHDEDGNFSELLEVCITL
jgi:hypothetical protein